MEIETFNSQEAKRAQKEYCDQKSYPHFAPTDGKCYRCKKDIYEQIDHGNHKTGISIERASGHITGCPHCNYSYCD